MNVPYILFFFQTREFGVSNNFTEFLSL